MNERSQSIFLLSLFNGTEYIENRFLIDRESIFRTIQSLKLNKLKFVQRIRQMMVQDKCHLSVSEISEKYGIPLRAVSDILKDQESFQDETSDLKSEFQQVKQKFDNQYRKGQSLAIQKEQQVIHQQETKIQAQQDNQSIEKASPNQLKTEPQEFSQRTKNKLNDYARNIMTVSKKSDTIKNEQKEQGKLLSFSCGINNDQETSSGQKQSPQKAKLFQVQSFNKLNRLQQNFDTNHNGDYTCKQCQKIYTKQHLSTLKNKQVLYNHFYNKHAQKFQCNQCNLTFKKLKILDKHYRNSHAQK